MPHTSSKDSGDTLTSKVIAAAVSLGAGWLAQRAVSALWKRTTGHGPARSIDDDDATVIGVVAFAAVSSAVAALVQAATTRSSRQIAARITSRAQAR